MIKTDDRFIPSPPPPPPSSPVLNFFPPLFHLFEVVDWPRRRLEKEAPDWLFKKLVLSVTCVQSPDNRFDCRSRFRSSCAPFLFPFPLFYSFLKILFHYFFFKFFFDYFELIFFVERVSWQLNTLEISCMLSIGLLAERIGRWPVGWVAGRMDVAML